MHRIAGGEHHVNMRNSECVAAAISGRRNREYFCVTVCIRGYFASKTVATVIVFPTSVCLPPVDFGVGEWLALVVSYRNRDEERRRSCQCTIMSIIQLSMLAAFVPANSSTVAITAFPGSSCREGGLITYNGPVGGSISISRYK